MAEAFARELILAPSDAQAEALLEERPQEARAFLSILVQVREELEGAGFDISSMPSVPLLLYSVAAGAVCEAVRAYRSKIPYLTFLARHSGPSSGERG